ncbi:MAG TPA: tetratricopeptide repeat protein [Stellaceae bacterium]|nr:tetratricopeptide repeat protein [Stellaceae bacterium]
MSAGRENRRRAGRLAGALALLCGILLGAALLAARPGAAQAISGADQARLEAQKEALFQRMLRNPADLDATFAYADVSARLGDYEAAVSALERMLLFNPNLPRVQLELGALYFRMGSFDIARDYFAKAAAANPPAEVRARIDEYMAQIEKASSRHHLSGYVFLGGQYQSDANVAPGSPLILSPIGPVLLNSQFLKQPSGSVFASGSLLYSYDLEDQRRDTIDVTAVGYLNHYFNSNVSRLDLDLLEVTAGPRINFPNGGLPGSVFASVKPYLIADEVGLGEAQYFAAGGAGLEYDETVWNDMLLKTVFEVRRKNFTNTPDRPLSTGLNGSDKLVVFSMDKPVAANAQLNLEFDYLDQSTELPYYTNSTYAVIGSYRMHYDAPFKATAYPWETSVFLGRAWSIYASPDPCCSTSPDPLVFSPSSQLTQRWRVGFTEAVPLTPRIAVVLQLERDIVSSNLSIYAYTSNSVLLGPQIRF